MTAKNPLDPETNFEERVFPEYPEEVPYKAPAGSVVVENYQNGQIIALASYPDLRQSLVRGRPRRRQVRTDLPVGRRER